MKPNKTHHLLEVNQANINLVDQSFPSNASHLPNETNQRPDSSISDLFLDQESLLIKPDNYPWNLCVASLH